MDKSMKLPVLIIWLSLFAFMLFPDPGTIVFIDSQEPEHLNPGGRPNHFSYEVLSNICEGLVRFKKGTSEIEPCLAVKWESDNKGMRWIFHLRKGVRFHDGTPFNSGIVVNSFSNRFFSKNPRNDFWKIYYSSIKNLKALGPHKLEITLRKKFYPFLMTLANPTASISIPSSKFEGKFIPVGTGPFKFDNWSPGKHIVIKKNHNYWGVPPILNKVIYKYIEKNSRRMRSLKNGTADIISVRSGTEQEQLRGIESITTLSYPITSTHYIMLNTRKPPLNNVNVRRALAHLINKQYIVKYVFQGHAVNAVTHVPPIIKGFNPHIRDYKYNLKKAKLLLEKAGCREGLELNLYYSSGIPSFYRIANIISGSAEKIGVKIKKMPASFNDMVRIYEKGEHDLGIIGWAGDYPDPDGYLTQILSMKEGNINFSFYNNPEYTKILDRARVTYDQAVREKLYLKAQEIIHRDIPSIPLFHVKKYLALSKKISGIYLSHNALINFRNAKKNE